MAETDSLVLDGISVGYRRGLVIHGVDLRVRRGQRVALLGANGAGKSTILKTISGFLRCQTGRVLFEGRDIHQTSRAGLVRDGVVHVPEGRRVFTNLTVEENLKVGAYTRKDDIRADLERVLTAFPNLKERFRLPAGVLSGGEQQMLALGRALMARPRLLLLDELSLGLAPITARAVYAALDAFFGDDLAVLLVEQNARLAIEQCSYVYVLRNGTISRQGKAALFSGPDALREAYLGTL